MHAAHTRGSAPESMSEDPKIYNLEEVEDLARKVLPKAVRISTCHSLLGPLLAPHWCCLRHTLVVGP